MSWIMGTPLDVRRICPVREYRGQVPDTGLILDLSRVGHIGSTCGACKTVWRCQEATRDCGGVHKISVFCMRET